MKKLMMGACLAVLFAGSANVFADRAAAIKAADDLNMWLGKIGNKDAVMGMAKGTLCNAKKLIEGKTVGYMDPGFKSYIQSLQQGDYTDRNVTLPMIKNAVNDQIKYNMARTNNPWTACPQ